MNDQTQEVKPEAPAKGPKAPAKSADQLAFEAVADEARKEGKAVQVIGNAVRVDN